MLYFLKVKFNLFEDVFENFAASLAIIKNSSFTKLGVGWLSLSPTWTECCVSVIWLAGYSDSS